MVPRSMKSASRAKGITSDGRGGVSSRSKAIVLLLAHYLLRGYGPRAVAQRTRWQVKGSAYRAVDGAGLDAIVPVAEGDGGGHDVT